MGPNAFTNRVVLMVEAIALQRVAMDQNPALFDPLLLLRRQFEGLEDIFLRLMHPRPLLEVVLFKVNIPV